MFDYREPNFDIVTYIGRNSVDNLKQVSDYLNFAIKCTILRQFPNITEQEEKMYAKKILTMYLVQNNFKFTRQENIRQNMEQIGKNRLLNLMIKSAIEKKAYNNRIAHLLRDNTYQDQCVTWVTDQINAGCYDDVMNALQSNPNMLSALIENYIQLSYNVLEDMKSNYSEITLSEPQTEKALNKLNLSICVDSFHKKSSY